MTDLVRCSEVSTRLGEPLAGTAPVAASWLLVEQPGPWGRKALTESRMDGDLAREIERRAGERGVRVQVVRREDEDARRVFRVESGVVRRATLDAAVDLIDEPDRGEPVDEPLFLVCTNAQRDACCALKGRSAVAALRDARPGCTWESSHLGGHRFAANLLVLPDGIAFGRLDAASVVRTVEKFEAGEIDLGHLRGRCAWDAPVQAAEWFLRHELGSRGLRDLVLESATTDGRDTAAVFVLAGRRRLRAVVRAQAAREPRIESCGSDELVTPVVHALVAIDDA